MPVAGADGADEGTAHAPPALTVDLSHEILLRRDRRERPYCAILWVWLREYRQRQEDRALREVLAKRWEQEGRSRLKGLASRHQLQHFERAGAGSPVEQAFLEASRRRLHGLRGLSAIGVLVAGSLALAAAGVPFERQPVAMFNWVDVSLAWVRAQVGYYPLPDMMSVPEGKFSMGGERENADEQPRHEVSVLAFKLGQHELTFAEYDVFVFAARDDEKVPNECKTLPDDQYWGRGGRPVIGVSWDCANAYAAWLTLRFPEKTTYRLPTEAEWEYAARAGTATVYWWGDAIGKNRANCGGCGSPWDGTQTAPVGSFAANQFGLYDTARNVWEWVQDCWHDSYDGAPPDGKAWEQESGGDCARRVTRGGAWNIGPLLVRSARDGGKPDFQHRTLGFRLAQDK